MSAVDVKSLFKSGKKSIKAFKIAAGPASSEVKAQEDTIENWETHQSQSVVPAVNVGLEEFKEEKQQDVPKSGVSWSKDEELTQTATVPQAKPSSAYVPPSQRRAEASLANPSLTDLSRVSSSASVPARSASGTGVAPPRLKLITSTAKKAMEDEAKRKEEDKQKKEAEKLARKEQLKAEFAQQASDSHHLGRDDSNRSEIKAAPLDQIYAKYIDRPKIGRKLSSKAA